MQTSLALYYRHRSEPSLVGKHTIIAPVLDHRDDSGITGIEEARGVSHSRPLAGVVVAFEYAESLHFLALFGF